MARFRLLAGPVPLHHQVYLDLRAALEAGEWRPGDRLPPERELAERYGCSLITVRRALGDLARERRLERTRGRGTFVTRPPIDLDLDGSMSFTEEVQQLGHDPATRVVIARTVAADAAVAEALEIAVGASVVHLERLRMADGEPLLLEQVFLPEARFPGLLASDLERGSLYELLDERYDTPRRPGSRVARAHRPSPARGPAAGRRAAPAGAAHRGPGLRPVRAAGRVRALVRPGRPDALLRGAGGRSCQPAIGHRGRRRRRAPGPPQRDTLRAPPTIGGPTCARRSRCE